MTTTISDRIEAAFNPDELAEVVGRLQAIIDEHSRLWNATYHKRCEFTFDGSLAASGDVDFRVHGPATIWGLIGKAAAGEPLQLAMMSEGGVPPLATDFCFTLTAAMKPHFAEAAEAWERLHDTASTWCRDVGRRDFHPVSLFAHFRDHGVIQE